MHEPEKPMKRASAMILGTGVSGLSVALSLLNNGYPVTLLERGDVGRESSWAGGGILSPLLPWEYGEAVSALALRSMSSYVDWIQAIEARSRCDAEYWRCGMDILEPANPEAALSWCTAHGLAAQLGHTNGGNQLCLPDIAQVRNPRLVSALREAVERLGGAIHTYCPAQSVSTQAGRVTAIHTDQGTFRADQFVIATGAWSGIPLPNLPGVPHLRPIRGQMLLFKLDPGALDTILYRKGLYIIPRRDGHVLVGSTVEDAGFDKSTDAATLKQLHAEAADMLPILGAMKPVQFWSGLRPGSPENIPVIDRHPDFDNVFVNTGHYRYGVTMAPASAELLVDLMEGNTPSLDPTPYRWQAVLERTWTESL